MENISEGNNQQMSPEGPQAQEQESVQETGEQSSDADTTEVQELLRIAAEEGLDKAVAVAKGRNPRVVDLFHDALENNPGWTKQLKGYEDI